MAISTGDLCELAAELAEEHGHSAYEYALRTYLSFEADGEKERANFWYALSVLLDDIAAYNIDPALPRTVH